MLVVELNGVSIVELNAFPTPAFGCKGNNQAAIYETVTPLKEACLGFRVTP
jgi:hypothetical protein